MTFAYKALTKPVVKGPGKVGPRQMGVAATSECKDGAIERTLCEAPIINALIITPSKFAIMLPMSFIVS